jgi:hypothetical protein
MRGAYLVVANTARGFLIDSATVRCTVGASKALLAALDGRAAYRFGHCSAKISPGRHDNYLIRQGLSQIGFKGLRPILRADRKPTGPTLQAEHP